MGRKLKYKPGSWYMQDDRTGLVQRSGVMKRQWDGLMVDERRWEPRQPQDYVKGVPDYQSVPVARPKPSASFYGPTTMELAQAASPGDKVIVVTSTAGIAKNDRLQVMMDNGEFFVTICTLPPADGQITLGGEMPYFASAGNVVSDLGPIGGNPFELDTSNLDGPDVLV